MKSQKSFPLRIQMAFVVIASLIGLGRASGSIADERDHDVRQPYTAERSNPVTYDSEIVFAVTAPYKTKLLRVWLPIPPSDAAQELISSNLSTFPLSVDPRMETEKVFGNQFAYFEFPNPQGAQIIRHQFKIRVWELNWNLDPAQIQAVDRWGDDFKPYLRSETQSVVADDRFKELLGSIVPKNRGPLIDLCTVMKWEEANFKYDHQVASLQASSVHALTNRTGHCSDYHGFCAAMGRLLNVPTRVTYGINTFPKSSPSHCKLEAFLPPHGWVSFDISETQKLVKAIQADSNLPAADKDRFVEAANARLCRGFRDNTWFLQTRGTDYELSPKASQTVPVVRTLYAEADGEPLADPDPSDPQEKQFSWMTAANFKSDVEVSYPLGTYKSLEGKK